MKDQIRSGKVGLLLTVMLLAAINIYAAAPEDDAIAKGVEYGKRGMYEEALSEFNKAIQINPDSAGAYTDRGVAYLAMASSEKAGGKDLDKISSNFNNAQSDFTRAIKLDPYFAAAYYNRGITYFAEPEKAIPDFTRAIELTPGHAKAYYYRAVEYFNLKDYARSRADVKKAQGLGYKVDPNFLKKLESKISSSDKGAK